MSRIRVMAAVAALIAVGLLGRAAAGYGLVGSTSAAGHSTNVLLIGDSLAWQAEPYFVADLTAHHRAQVDSMVFGGTAPCDWLPKLPAELARTHPRAAVVEFSGDAFTPCMHDPATGLAYSGADLVARYTADVQSLMALLERHGVTTYWSSPPPFRSASPVPAQLTSLYRSLPFVWPDARFVDAGEAVSDHGRYADYLPCLGSEPCTYADPATGQPAAKVRAPDGIHFCPTGPPARAGVTATCDVWSSGAWRYAAALADPVLHDLRL